MNFRQFIALLAARKWLFAGVFAAVVLATIAWTFSQPRLYTGTAQVLLEGRGTDGRPMQLPENYLATQATLITSERVGQRAVAILGLADLPEYRQAFGGGQLAPDVLARAIANALAREIRVEPMRESDALRISFSHGDPQRTADVANAFVQAYIDESIDLRANPDRAGATVLEAEAARLREELEALQGKLATLERERGVTAASESTTVDNTRLQQMAAELTRLERELADSQQVVAAARASIASNGNGSPEVMRNSLVAQLQQEQLRLERRIADLGRSFGPEHPNMAAARGELDAVNRRLRNAVSTVVAGLVRQHESLRRREADLRAGLDQQRGRVVAVRQDIEAARNLRQDVERARRAYDEAQAQVDKAAVAARTVQADIVPIGPAVTPTLPSSPNFARNGGIAVVLGALLGLGSVLLAEASRPRVRLADDLERIIRAPLVGSLGHLPRRTLALAGNDPRAAGARKRIAAASPPKVKGPAAGAAAAGPGHAGAGGSAQVGATTEVADRKESGTGHPVLDALLERGLIAPSDVAGLREAAEREGLRVGDAAVATGLVKARDLRTALARHSDYPLLDPDESVISREIFTAFDVNHPFLDELRRLRSQLKARWFDGAERRERAGRSIAVLSEGRGEGKTFTAANLAVSFAQMGELTLLIDGDMWGGRVHDLFALDNGIGFSTLLARRCNPRDVFREIPGLDGLTVIPSGPEVPNASDLLAGHTAELLLALFEKAFDVIIIDTPSADGKPDAGLIASKAGGYILVARQHRTLTRGLAQVVRQLEPMGAKLVGTVLMRA